MENSNDEVAISETFITRQDRRRALAFEIAELAIQLATQRGEAVRRPLSREQLRRALQVNAQEAQMIHELRQDGWDQMLADGTLPEDAMES